MHTPFKKSLLCAAALTTLSQLVQAGCSTSGGATFSAQHCDVDYIQYFAGTGTAVLTVDSFTVNGDNLNGGHGGVELGPTKPDSSAETTGGPYEQTINLTGSTAINHPTYSGVIMQSNKADRKATVNADSAVTITSNGGSGGIWVLNDTSGEITITSAATVTVTGADGITGVTNLGPVSVTNTGNVTSTTNRGLYADGGNNNTLSDGIVVNILNGTAGQVNSVLAGARSINYNGLSKVENRGYVKSTTRQGAIAWSNNGPASVINSGTAISVDDHAAQAATEFGDVTVVNDGSLTSTDDTNINVQRSGYSAIHAGVDMDPSTTGAHGNVSVTNNALGVVSAVDDFAIVTETPLGNITIVNSGSVTGLQGITATASNGSVDITNSNTITANGSTGVGLYIVAATSGTLENSGTISSQAVAIKSDATGNLTQVKNLVGGTIRGQLSLAGSGNVANAGTIELPASSTSTMVGNYTQSIGSDKGLLRVKVLGSSQYGKLTVGGSVTLPSSAKISVVTGDSASCRSIAVGTTLASVIAGGTLSASSFDVTDDCDGLNFSAVRNGNAIDLVAALPVVNGTCGAAHGVTIAYAPIPATLCSLGSASAVSNNASSWSWTCTGSGGGSPASCSAPKAQTTTGTGSGYFEITASSGATAWQVQSANFVSVASTGSSAPAGYSFPHGLLDLRLNSGTAGSSATVTITYPTALPVGSVYWKYGKEPAPGNQTPHWYIFPGAVISGNTVTLTIFDGQQGDDDLTANSLIVDPGGPGAPLGAGGATSIPTLSQWGQIVLSVLLGLAGLGRRKGVLAG